MKVRVLGIVLALLVPLAPTVSVGFGTEPAKKAVKKPVGAPVPLQGAPGNALTPDEAIIRANDYFNGAQTLVADFVQIGGNGQRLEGKLYIRKPGRMRFEYNPPAPLEVVADGTSVAVKDMKLHKQDFYFIGQTPLKFLLKDHIDLARDTKVVNVGGDATTTSIELEDEHTFSGTSHITLMFDTPTFQLKQWNVVDPQGYETAVSLFNARFDLVPDMQYFYIEGQNPLSTRK